MIYSTKPYNPHFFPGMPFPIQPMVSTDALTRMPGFIQLSNKHVSEEATVESEQLSEKKQRTTVDPNENNVESYLSNDFS